MDNLALLRTKLNALTLFRQIHQHEVMTRLLTLLEAADAPPPTRARCYADFAAAVFENGGNLTDILLDLTLQSDNIYARKRAKNLLIDSKLSNCLEWELETLSQAARLLPAELRGNIDEDIPLPAWDTHTIDFARAYAERMDNLFAYGFGIYTRYRMFTLRSGVVTPVKTPDPISLDDLIGYARQKKTVDDNTRALLDGKPAANVLLYGDAGTGKSSTVKALVNAYYAQGLRLIELPKNQFASIPALAESLADNPLKFILFIDDLSFSQAGEEFHMLKGVLEGSASAKAPNIVVYATSNRRHIVKELFSDRDGDDVHRNETLQDLCALSHRFGLSVGYFKPDKQAYLDIVRALMQQFGLDMDDKHLEIQAERFAVSGRSPRTARQFVDFMLRNKAE